MIVDSWFEEGPPQEDGRRFVKETHVDDKGSSFTYEWLGGQDADTILSLRASELNILLEKQKEASLLVYGTKLPLTKYQFRQLFTQSERIAVDSFEVSFESMAEIDGDIKSLIRSGFKDFNTAQDVARPFLPDVLQMLDLFEMLGVLTTERKAQIVSAGNG